MSSTPWHLAAASSMGRVSERCTALGEAPGQAVVMVSLGRSVAGIASRSRRGSA